MIKLVKRVHITMVDEIARQPRIGDKTTAMCGRQKRIIKPDTWALFGFCPGCVQALQISFRARLLERNDAVERCFEISMILNAAGPARREVVS